MLLGNYFDDSITIENRAISGRHTQSFIENGDWNYILDNVKAGDYVFMGFCHNDQSYLDLETYEKNLNRMISDVRSRFANPVICTPVPRRRFNSSTFIGGDSFGDYKATALSIAERNDVPVIDICTPMSSHFQNMGALSVQQEKSLKYYMTDPYNNWESNYASLYKALYDSDYVFEYVSPSSSNTHQVQYAEAYGNGYIPNLPSTWRTDWCKSYNANQEYADNTHLTKYGADWVAYYAAQQIKNNPELSSLAAYINNQYLNASADRLSEDSFTYQGYYTK